MGTKIDRDKLLQLHDNVCFKARKLMEKKNHDYSGGDDAGDPFLNFTRVERLGITDTKRGFMVRLTDKLSRLITFIDTGTYAVPDEKIEDTVMDMINYTLLFYAYNLQEKGKDEYEENSDTRSDSC